MKQHIRNNISLAIGFLCCLGTVTAHAEVKYLGCQRIVSLEPKPEDLAKVASPLEVFRCTGKVLVYEAPRIDENFNFIRGHYALLSPYQ